MYTVEFNDNTTAQFTSVTKAYKAIEQHWQGGNAETLAEIKSDLRDSSITFVHLCVDDSYYCSITKTKETRRSQKAYYSTKFYPAINECLCDSLEGIKSNRLTQKFLRQCLEINKAQGAEYGFVSVMDFSEEEPTLIEKMIFENEFTRQLELI